MLWVFVLLGVLITVGSLAMNQWVLSRTSQSIHPLEQVQPAQTAIVPGALVYDDQGHLSPVLEDRVELACRLYHRGCVGSLLLSGDHGRSDYDEVNSMRLYAESRGIPRERIFLDHAGFSTYETMVRARKVFLVERAVVVTNRFHLARSVFLARAQGIEAQGLVADRRRYLDARSMEIREFLARCKAFVYVYLLRPPPTYLGATVPIEGEPWDSHDRTD